MGNFFKDIGKVFKGNVGKVTGTAVGAVLAPITGGASLVVGGMAGGLYDNSVASSKAESAAEKAAKQQTAAQQKQAEGLANALQLYADQSSQSTPQAIAPNVQIIPSTTAPAAYGTDFSQYIPYAIMAIVLILLLKRK